MRTILAFIGAGISAVVLLLSVVTGSAHAQDIRFPSGVPTEHIVNFNSDATLKHGGSLQVTETIVYEFGLTPRHGIFRYVPVQYMEEGGTTFYLTFKVGSVTDETGKPWKYQQSRQAGNQVLKIGDAGKALTGQHTYKISYSLDPVVRNQEDSDLFIYDVTGNGWTVPIDHAAATVHFESPIKPLNTFCYTGTVRSRAQECTLASATDGYTATMPRALQPGEGLTIANDLQSGAVTTYLVPNQKPPFEWATYNGYFVGATAGALAVVSLILGWLWYRFRRSRETEVPEYESPDNLTPAEIGLLIDNKTGMTEVTASLINLAVNGYLKIDQTQGKKLLKKPKYTFIKKKGSTGLSPDEKIIFDAIFGTKTTQTLDGLDNGQMALAVSSFNDVVRSGLEAKGYYAKARLTIGKWAWLIALVIFVVSLAVTVNAGADIGNIIGEASVAGVGLLFLVLSFYKSRLTKAGYVEWGEVAGFKRFLSMTEKERLAFTDAPKRNPKQFSALLPFAIALGVEKEWTKQFEGMDVVKSTNYWYHGYYPLTMNNFTNDLSSFGGAINSNFAPISTSSSSSSGGSSGGFSGGGVGGGGGGSW
ncbi:DUF2207 domain-containing protein [Patescibacteria group bacterium]|nr:DUF2207 domain-containing protein [Patescibacteria group bacterium]